MHSTGVHRSHENPDVAVVFILILLLLFLFRYNARHYYYCRHTYVYYAKRIAVTAEIRKSRTDFIIIFTQVYDIKRYACYEIKAFDVVQMYRIKRVKDD